MPSKDASQFTQYKKYSSILGRPTNDTKTITHLYQPVPSVRSLQGFLLNPYKAKEPQIRFAINYPTGLYAKPKKPSQ